ncbi:MAG: hypothetical protein ACLFQV_07745 [Vulcanimicrobiota bacterium]
MKNPWILSILIVLLAVNYCCAKEVDELKDDAQSAEQVYAEYVTAVHQGKISRIKSLVYSQSLLLWNKKTKTMLKMTQQTIPQSPRLISSRPEKEYQYNYMVLTYQGVNTDGKPVTGEIKMIVENGEWKVYQEVWK